MTHVLTIHHFGHTRLDFFLTFEQGLVLAKQASEQLRIQGKWKRGPNTGVEAKTDETSYFDVFTEGVITLRPISEPKE